MHLHDCYPPGRFFTHAADNFERAARARGWNAMRAVLMLSETAGTDWFGRLAAGADTGSWTVETTADPSTLLARQDARRLVLIAGRQVVTREGLEVLLLGTRATVADRLPIREVLAAGELAGALRVVPWGVGKWLFGRGRLVNQLIDEARPGDGFFLGDSGGRPVFWRNPAHFDRASRRGIRVLPGTDPLPFPSEVSRPGGFGFTLAWPEDVPPSAEAIKASLRGAEARLTPYGQLERVGRFLRNQLAMQRRKRRGSPPN